MDDKKQMTCVNTGGNLQAKWKIQDPYDMKTVPFSNNALHVLCQTKKSENKKKVIKKVIT